MRLEKRALKKFFAKKALAQKKRALKKVCAQNSVRSEKCAFVKSSEKRALIILFSRVVFYSISKLSPCRSTEGTEVLLERFFRASASESGARA